jgi:hypothetical protein
MRLFTFQAENGVERLCRFFVGVERRGVRGWVTMDDNTIRGYAAS